MTVPGFDLDALREREFPWAARGKAIYLNNASTGPLPERARRVLDEYNLRRAEAYRLSDAQQFETLARGRELVAALIGASPAEVAMATNTGWGINVAAAALPLEPGDVIVGAEGEFPANVYPWMHHAAQRGVEYVLVPTRDGLLDEEALLAALDRPRVKVLAISWVGFATGYTADLARLGDACRERGVWFVVDAIQGLGALTLDVGRCHVDVLAAGAQKWLLSPWGSGFMYVRRELIPRLHPGFASWLAVRDSDDFTRLLQYDVTWRDDARRFEFLTLPFQDFAGMNASLELFHELGPARIAAHVASLADVVVDWAQSRRVVTLVTPADRARRAGIVAIRPRDAAAASAALRAAGVSHSVREGLVRLSPHFYNTNEDVLRALAALDAAI